MVAISVDKFLFLYSLAKLYYWFKTRPSMNYTLNFSAVSVFYVNHTTSPVSYFDILVHPTPILW